MSICVAHTIRPMGTDRDRVDAHLPLRPVEFHILLSLSSGDRHGYGIIQDIETRGDAAVPDVGTMYRALARLVDQALIQGAPAGESADERRINYRITSLGTRVARAEARRLEALAQAARLTGLLTRKAT
jgi:DNA-binding PadR family transcriptional regulator